MPRGHTTGRGYACGPKPSKMPDVCYMDSGSGPAGTSGHADPVLILEQSFAQPGVCAVETQCYRQFSLKFLGFESGLYKRLNTVNLEKCFCTCGWEKVSLTIQDTEPCFRKISIELSESTEEIEGSDPSICQSFCCAQYVCLPSLTW